METTPGRDRLREQQDILRSIQLQQAGILEDAGLVRKARDRLPEPTRVRIESSGSQPVFYRRPAVVWNQDTAGYVVDATRTEFGICFRSGVGPVPEKLYVPVVIASSREVETHSAESVKFTGDDIRIIYALADGLAAVRDHGILPDLSWDGTEIDSPNTFVG